MQPALYTVETVRDIRTRALHGQRLRELARYLGWEIEQLRSVARKHQIDIVDEGMASQVPVNIAEPKPIRPSLSAAEAKRPVASRGQLEYRARRGTLKQFPRNVYFTIAISEAAELAIREQAERIGKKAGTALAVTIDHIARRKDFRGFIDSAFGEVSS